MFFGVFLGFLCRGHLIDGYLNTHHELRWFEGVLGLWALGICYEYLIPDLLETYEAPKATALRKHRRPKINIGYNIHVCI